MNKDNEVLIGKKDTSAYVFAVLTQADMNDKIKIKARGAAISRAVDVSQIAIRRLGNWTVNKVAIGTEERENPDMPQKQKVSYIEINVEMIKNG